MATVSTKLLLAVLLFFSVTWLQGCGGSGKSDSNTKNSKTCNCIKNIVNGQITSITKQFKCHSGSKSYCQSAEAACTCPMPQPSSNPSNPSNPKPGSNTKPSTSTGSVTLPPKCAKIQQKDCNSDKNPKCLWKFVNDDALTADLKTKGYTKGWEVSCFPRTCIGMLGDVCKLHSESCQWDYVDDKDKALAAAVQKTGLKGWQLSCIPKDSCERLQHDVCELHPKKCHWDFSSGNWEDSCKTGPKPEVPATPAFTPPPSCQGNQEKDCGPGTKNSNCKYFAIDDSKLPEKLTKEGTKGWEVSCIPPQCVGLSHDVCDLHAESCQWDWVEDKPEKNQASADAVKKTGWKGWQLSCIPKDSCEGIQQAVCSLHHKKCHWDASCKAGPAPTSLSERHAEVGNVTNRPRRPRVGGGRSGAPLSTIMGALDTDSN